MKTSTNGQPAEWTDEIRLKWENVTKTWPSADLALVTDANYFTPRPYVDEYNRGSRDEGFVYILGPRQILGDLRVGRQVCLLKLSNL